MEKEEQACLGLTIGVMASNNLFGEQKSRPSIKSKIDTRLAAMDLANCDVEKANMVYDYIMQDQKEELYKEKMIVNNLTDNYAKSTAYSDELFSELYKLDEEKALSIAKCHDMNSNIPFDNKEEVKEDEAPKQPFKAKKKNKR